MKKLFPFYFLLLTTIGCEKELIEPELKDNELQKTESTTLNKQENTSYVIEALPYKVRYVTWWSVERYAPINGKIVGIWPDDSRRNSAGLARLKNYFGFNFLFAGPGQITSSIAAGFPSSNLMINIEPDYYTTIINYPQTWAYYVDEPYEDNKDISNLVPFVRNHFPSALYVMGGYRRESGFTSMVSSADKVMFTAYDHWYRTAIGNYWNWPYDPDQRPDWTEMKEKYGAKFSMTWIGAHKDRSTYGELLGHASNLGLMGIWLYQYDATDDGNILDFCDAAWRAGYLRKFLREYREELRCDSQYNDCDPSVLDGWYVYSETALGVQEVFP